MDTWGFALALAIWSVGWSSGQTLCPDYDVAECQLWSSNETWPTNQVPVDGDPVTIDKCILLDTDTASLDGVLIASGGSLVFDPMNFDPITLTTKYVRVEGLLRIGSERCRYDGQANILLTGAPEESPVDPDFGQKFIGVAPGGQLELHGERKTPWTKLNQTLEQPSLTNGFYFDNKVSQIGDTWRDGILAVVIDPDNSVVRYKESFFIGRDNEYWFNKDSERIIQMLDWFPPGHVLLLASQRNALSPFFNSTPIIEAVEKALYCKVGHSRLRHVKFREAWTAVAIKEQPWRSVERVGRHLDDKGFYHVKNHLFMPNKNAAFYVEARAHHEQSWNAQNRILAGTYDQAVPIINMGGEVSSWKAGEEIVVTSTDFDMLQAEEGHLERCDLPHRDITCTDSQARLALVRSYTHWGEMVHGVDMRGEVASLSRNIVIKGLDTVDVCLDEDAREVPCPVVGDHFGGQIKIKSGFQSAHIQGVRLQHMGQDGNDDAYPIFFDSAGNTVGKAYVRENAIVNSYRRCVVLKATHNLTIEYNVAYRHVGHCFYLMDGAEMYNVINGNLAALTFKTPLTTLEEREVAGFFITNPLTRVTNNCAAGSEGKGIFYAFPPEPLGSSQSLGLMANLEASRTPFLEFYNNVAHSNFYSGLDMLKSLNEDGSNYNWNSFYNFKENATDPNSADVPSYVRKSTFFKNRFENIIARGGWLVFEQMSLADSLKAIQVNQASSQRAYIRNSIVLGETRNIGQPQNCWNGSANVPSPRSCVLTWDIRTPIQGIVFQDGPFYVDTVHFDDFKSTEIYPAGAISFSRNNKWWTSPMTNVIGATWGFQDGADTGNRVYHATEEVYGFTNYTGDLQAFFRDLDGSVTGYPLSTVIKPYPFLYTDACFYRDNWMLYVCPHRYGKLSLWARWETRQVTQPFMTRDDIPEAAFPQDWTTTANFPVILGGDYSYILHFEPDVPTEIWVTGDGLELYQTVRFGMCLPMDAEWDLYTYMPDYRPNKGTWNQVFSIEDLDATDIATSYFFDDEVGVVFFKLRNDLVWEYGEINQCPGNRCPRVRVTITAGNPSDGNCLDRAYPKYTRAPPAFDRRRSETAFQPLDMPATEAEPSLAIGAHSSYPFSGVEIAGQHGFLAWGEWSECSTSCGPGVSNRRRSCDDPMGCSGPSIEYQACNLRECPEFTGEYGEWSEWSECSASCGGGSQSRTRDCVSEEACNGPLSQEQECNTQECPVNGEFGNWGEWGECSTTCGGGVRSRSRSCDSPAPQHGGADCVGDTTQAEACNSQECPVDGQFSNWSEWSECSASCGGGQMTRSRTCDNPEPAHGGQDCEGAAQETDTCGMETCPPDEVVCVTVAE